MLLECPLAAIRSTLQPAAAVSGWSVRLDRRVDDATRIRRGAPSRLHSFGATQARTRGLRRDGPATITGRSQPTPEIGVGCPALDRPMPIVDACFGTAGRFLHKRRVVEPVVCTGSRTASGTASFQCSLIVPWNEAVDSAMSVSGWAVSVSTRAVTNAPVAPAKRPVPPVITHVSAM